jgi:signal transduction histidine kinase
VLYGLGYALARGHRSRRGLEEKALQLEREQDERARAAVAEERARMARDLHDALGHAISVMVLQIGAVRTRLRPDQVAECETLLTAEQTGRDSVSELRRMVGVLREAPSGNLAPPVSLSAIDDLVTSVRAAGVSVEISREGQVRALPAGVDIAAYRVAQEALTNVVRHAPSARARLRIVYEPDEVVVEVNDDGAGEPVVDGEPGQGLIGMHERVAAFGGTLVAEAIPGRGFVVRAHLPLEMEVGS